MKNFSTWFEDRELEKTVYRMILKSVIVVAFLMAGLDYLFYSKFLAFLEFSFALVSLALLYLETSHRLRYTFSSRIFIFFMALPIYWNLLYNESAIESSILFIFLPVIIIILRPLREVVLFALLFGLSFLYITFSAISPAEFTYMELFKLISVQVLISFFIVMYVQTNKSYQVVISKQSKALQEANVKLEELYKEKEAEASTDSLTGLSNRAAMMSRIEYLFARYRRHREVFSLIIFDIDHFKRVNDTYGHQKGDEVLARVAEITLESIREVDTAARYGGEEFIVLLPQTNAVAAMSIAERIRSGLEEKVLLEGKGITASFGVIEIEERLSIEKMISLADQALYKAKSSGRNRVLSA